jgi:hypothetical protein
MQQQRPAGDRVQHLVRVGAHARALPRGKDDDGRGTLGILAALAIASVGQAQLHPIRPKPIPPTPVPPIRPMPSLPTPSSPSLAPRTSPVPRTIPVQAPVQVVPPSEGVNSHGDGGDECENRDGNALNDPDDCGGNAASSVAEPAGAPVSVNDSAGPVADDSAANLASEPAPQGWRPSWWMIVLGVGAILLLLGWMSGGGRRR